MFKFGQSKDGITFEDFNFRFHTLYAILDTHYSRFCSMNNSMDESKLFIKGLNF